MNEEEDFVDDDEEVFEIGPGDLKNLVFRSGPG